MKTHRRLRRLLLLLLGAVLPGFAAEERRSLDGLWAFTIDPQKLERPGSEWDTLPVPGNWDTFNAYAQHVGRGWYRREFTVPAAWRGRRVRVQFDAVYEKADVSVNGTPLGRHEGGYTPFEFDVTPHLRWDGPNTLTVSADNTYRRGAWWAWGGISRSVELVANADVRLIWQHIRTEPDLGRGTAKVMIEYLIANDGTTAASVSLAGTLRFANAVVGSTSARTSVPGRSSTRVTTLSTLPADRVHLWHFDHPQLYELTSTASVGGAVQHERRDRFGIRKVEVKADGLYLNGERVRVVGFNRVHDHRAYGNTEPDHLVRQDVDRMKRYGGNFMRIMHAPAAPNLLDYLDEKGVMVFTEIPVWGDQDPNVIPNNPRTKQWLREMVDRDYNHPSVIGWSVGNELTKHFEYVKTMIEYTRRELDPHRLITYVSYTGARPEYGPQNDPISVVDLVMMNAYGPDAGRIADIVSERWPGRPIFFSEFGARQFGETLDSRIPGLEERWASLAHRPHVIGTSLWTYNDYRSNYPGSAPGELRSWGIVDLWRRNKAAARDVARLHSPVRALRVAGRTARIEPRSRDEFPSYTLRGYTLAWEWRAPDGTTHGGGASRLPDLAPGSEAVEIALTGQPAAANATNLVVSLLTPHGYLAHETATHTPGEPAAPAVVTGTSAPQIHQAHPLAGGFMLGYSTHADDRAFTVEYGTTPGTYTQTLTLPHKGALAIRGLQNGRTYYGRLRREVEGRGPSAWSAEFSVTPDGGLPPAPPRLLGVLRGEGFVVARFSPVPKAIAYRVRWHGGSSAGERLITGSEPAVVFLPGSATGAISVRAINANGESPASNAITAP